ncbi:MAG TPA: hypothetical protein VFQ67_02250 [Allosphingosinicella sp.]|jgi:hypothetical protein|nr:hypothetical protein [Allosphingosinicella sp.]
MTEDLQDLASRWIEYTARHDPATGDLRDIPATDLGDKDEAAQRLLDLLFDDPRAACQVVEHILDQTRDPWILENVGAGPLETLMSGAEAAILAWVESLPSKHANAEEALRHVWTGGLPPQAQDVLRRARSD